MAMFKEMGWTVSCNPVSGRLCIYREDCPGEMVVKRTDKSYDVEIYAHADKLVASTSATFDQLYCEE